MYYKKINFNVNNIKKIKEIILSNHLNNTKITRSNNYINIIQNLNIETEIKNQLGINHLLVREIVLVTIPSNTESLIHNDGNLRKLSLIIPITNCSEIYFNWWKPINKSNIVYYDFPCKYSQSERIEILNKSDAELIENTLITGSTIVNIQNFHSIKNNSLENNLEILLSIRLILFNEETFENFEKTINNI